MVMVIFPVHAAALIAVLCTGVNGFTPSIWSHGGIQSTKVSTREYGHQRSFSSQLQMGEENGSEPVFITSNLKKEIVYDEASGRFYETGYGEGDCIPEEEFCMTDNDTGEMIRLTVEEKERIFLDALQVRIFDVQIIWHCKMYMYFLIYSYRVPACFLFPYSRII
jgi:hypothetical protein